MAGDPSQLPTFQVAADPKGSTVASGVAAGAVPAVKPGRSVGPWLELIGGKVSNCQHQMEIKFIYMADYYSKFI